MKIINGIIVILVTICLMAVLVPKAKAGTLDELREILDNKQVVYDGVCWFDKNGVLTFKQSERVGTRRCVVGMELPDQTRHYLLILDQNGPVELLVYDEKQKKQERLWGKGTAV